MQSLAAYYAFVAHDLAHQNRPHYEVVAEGPGLIARLTAAVASLVRTARTGRQPVVESTGASAS